MYKISNTVYWEENGVTQNETLAIVALRKPLLKWEGRVVTKTFAKDPGSLWAQKAQNSFGMVTLTPKKLEKNMVTRGHKGLRHFDNLFSIDTAGEEPLGNSTVPTFSIVLVDDKPTCLKNNGKEKDVTFKCDVKDKTQLWTVIQVDDS